MDTLIDIKLQVGSSLIVTGPSCSGKTQLVLRCLHPENQEAVFGQKVTKIFFIYSIWQPAYDKLKEQNPEVEFLDNFSQVPPDIREIHVVIFDDMFLKFQTDKKAKQELLDIFFRLCHHKNMFTIALFQALHGHGLRNVFLNAHYQIIFPVKGDISAINYISRQMFPNLDSHFLQNALLDASKQRFGFIFIDRSPTADPIYFCRNFVYPIKDGKFYIASENGENCEKRRLSKKAREIK